VTFFAGRFRNGVDAKGRTSVPAPFRAALAAQAGQSGKATNGPGDGVYLFPAQHLRCLEGAGPLFLEQRARILDGLDPLDPRRAALERIYFGEAVFCPMDANGRISLPDPLRSQFGIGEDIVFVGVRDRFEVWAPAAEAVWAEEARAIAGGIRSLRDLGAAP
jgi:MraZ protein